MGSIHCAKQDIKPSKKQPSNKKRLKASKASISHAKYSNEKSDEFYDFDFEKSLISREIIQENKVADDETLDDMIKNLDESFSDFKANMDRKLFSKIRNGSHPKKATAISLCIALELSYDETNDLLVKAGYILNNSEKFDVIISYFLKKKNYNIYQINEALLYYDQPQLGIA